MEVNTPEVSHVVDDYDFTFLNGMVMPVTVNETVGDTIHFDSAEVRIDLSSKPSINDPAYMLPAENIVIYTKHLVTWQHRIRKVVAITPEQQHEWTQTLKEASGTVN